MVEIIGVKFKNRGKVYFFDPSGNPFKVGDLVVVETANGIDCGNVTISNKKIEQDQVVQPLKKIVRPATDRDKEVLEENKRRGKDAYKIANEKIKRHNLEMKLVEVEYAFSSNKILFYFTADGRVDFRDLVKDLAAVFKTRIELRQIGVKDETKMIGGLGTCGRAFCCSQFLTEFYPVSIKMAKEQGLSLNPAKISGACGRLMCCLRYEQDSYEKLRKSLPKLRTAVMTGEGKGTITEVNVLTGKLKVKLSELPDAVPIITHVNKIKLILPDLSVSKDFYENELFPISDEDKNEQTERSSDRPLNARSPQPKSGGVFKSASNIGDQRAPRRDGADKKTTPYSRDNRKRPDGSSNYETTGASGGKKPAGSPNASYKKKPYPKKSTKPSDSAQTAGNRALEKPAASSPPAKNPAAKKRRKPRYNKKPTENS